MADKGGRGQGSFVFFSEKKETKDLVASFSSALSGSQFPLPSCSPLRIRTYPSLLLLRVEKGAKAPLPPSPRMRRRRTVRRPSPSRRRCRRRRYPRCRLPRSPPAALATPTHLLRPDVCIVALPDGLIVVCISFRPSPRAPSTLLPLFRCVVGRSSRWIPGLLL